MKKIIEKVIAVLMIIAMVSALTACGSSSASEAEAGETYTGTVSSISEDEMTISTDDGDVLITLSENTEFSYGASGGMSIGDGQGGDIPSEGESMSGGEVPTGTGDSAPDGESAQSEDGTVPDKPEGEVPTGTGDSAPDGGSGQSEDGTVPDKPEGESGGSAGDGSQEGGAPSSNDAYLTYEDISVGDEVTVVIGDDGVAESVTVSSGDAEGNAEDMGGSSETSDIEYSAVYEYTEDTEVSGETLESTGTDENVVLLSTEGISAVLDGVSLIRTSDDSTGGDNSSFYGVGASALVTNGTLVVKDSTITTDAAGGAGVFAYGDGVAYVMDTTISTQADTSGGIHVAGGGTLYAWDLTVETNGESSAAIRSDRGSGTMVVDGGTYISKGTGSPAVYSTAEITVNDAELTAESSEAICIEGLNTIRLFDCDLTGNMSDSSQNDCTWNVILYQSMSGDSEEGNSTFEMVGGTLTAGNGGMFYTTNTESTFIISEVDITYSEDSDFLLKCTGNSNERGWGTTGSNGADCSFTAINQMLLGDVIWDTISELDFYLTEDSTLTGAVINDESQAGDGGDGYAAMYIDSSSTWVVTGDSTVSSLYSEGTIVDEEGNLVTIQGTDGTVYVSGDSDYTVTVDSYSDSADTSGASVLDFWSEFEAEQIG